MDCSICNLEIPVQVNGWDQGHNAEPVTDGRCCGSCNASVVLPTRIKNMIDGDCPSCKEDEPNKIFPDNESS